MAKNHVQPGKVLEFTAPSGGVVSGQGYVIGNTFGVSLVDAAVGELFRMSVDECWELAAASADAWAEGALLYWDDSSKELSDQATSGFFLVGVALGAKVATEVLAKVRLNAVHVTALP